MITINLDKARTIAADLVRAEREPLFADLDIAQKRALVAGDTEVVAAIETKLDLLRDAPEDQRLADAVSADDLKAAVVAVVQDMHAVIES